MAKNPNLNFEKDEVLWHDRKRILGMPISFTVYDVTKDRFTTRKGLFRTETNEILLYRILDLKLVRTLGQKVFGVGSITLFTADQSDNTFEIKSVKRSKDVYKFISTKIEQQRMAKGLTGREMYGAAGLVNDDKDITNFTDNISTAGPSDNDSN